MEFSKVSAISPIDGRYRNQTESLAYYFSEAALINYRIFVEIEYFIALCELPLAPLKGFDKERYEDLHRICRDFTFKDAKEVKSIEKITNHDVKAVEYYIKKKFDKLGLSKYKEFIHFGLTSQDVTNTAIPYAMKLAVSDVIMPAITKVVHTFNEKSKEWKNIPMLSRTHGQPASPTHLGKEIRVYTERLRQQIKLLNAIPFTAKFGGATGNFNAHMVAYPEINWPEFADNFIKKIGLQRQKTTTQIEHYDNLAAFFDGIKRINNILIDFDRDIWTYISMDYFKQKVKENETGSSTMPHKVNPIDFENSEGNFGVANALFEHLSSKLPVSRLQRDLTDSTVTRVIGTPFAHSLIAYKSLLNGVNKLILNQEAINSDLDNNWAVISEAIQTILRREGYAKPYETLKDLTRKNEHIDKDTFHAFINKLKVSAKVKEELRSISPYNYTGVK
jgi:adenylosuccinate lyase